MLMLATDLDGTFLEGSLKQRNRFYQFIQQHRQELTLVFVTGRAVSNVLPLLDDAFVPRPDYIIADIGASLVHGESLTAIEPLSSKISARWVGEERVLASLPKGLVIERQQQVQRLRCSFYTDDLEKVAAVKKAVEPLGCDVLYSANRYLDVLPCGVSKGNTLKELVALLGIPEQDVLVAGDTLNDVSMFVNTPFKGVVVANAETDLIAETSSREDTFHATQNGTAGMWEALSVFGYLKRFELSSPRKGEAELVVVYHRQPFDEKIDDGEIIRQLPLSPNGIIPTLNGLFRDGRRGAWVAWSSVYDTDENNFDSRIQLKELGDNLTISRIHLSSDDVDTFYQKFSKEALWPIIHGFVERAAFDHAHWQHFCIVNRRFAEQTAGEAAAGALVWIHDYNLWLVPHYLRSLRPDLNIAFFHHTPFPSADIFNIIPWSEEIIASLLSCDYIGFHIPRYAENFVDAARSKHAIANVRSQAVDARFIQRGTALSLDRVTSKVETEDRMIDIGIHPVGLDLKRVERSLQSVRFKQLHDRLGQQFTNIKIIVCAERLDYMKGPLQKIKAFERFLSIYPVWREKITLIYICTPPANGVKIYDQLRYQVEHAAGRLNSSFGTTSWTPLHLLFKYSEFEELAAYLAIADVAWITPLRDGLNLVAKEYVAVKNILEADGSLIVSEFAGVSVEMIGALLTNPFDCSEMASTLEIALTMPLEEKRERLRRLGASVGEHDVHQWVEDFMGKVVTEEAEQEILSV